MTASGSNSNCDSSRQSSSGPPPPSARTQEGAAKLKARRRAEIERRASLLDPPIPGNVLVHIPSFQAAIQIPVLLDDAAWELLKPRLISQRQDAERKAQEAAESSDVVASGMSDEDWEAIQAPIRAKLAEHADAVISDQWDDGKSVGEDNCAQFAAEVILATRGKFHASLVQEAIAARNEGRSPAQSAGLSNKISLETMKWLFDYRIKPITEKFRKEIFLCNGCKGPIQKWYSFEGVLQHYAAKHTNALSHGSVVVYWRAEWPERPPFHPEPQKRILDAQHAAYAQPQAGGPGQYGHGYYSQAYPQVPTPGFSAPPVFQPGPTPYGHQPAYPAAVPYAPAPYAPPSTYYQPYGVASVEHPSPQPAFPPTGPATGNPYVSPPPLAAAPGIHHPPGAYGGYNYGAYGANAQAPPAMVSPVGYTQDYPTQLNSIAQVSRDVQSRLAHVKDLPGNVKVYVTIHHVAKAFRARFSESPPLSMFIEGLSNNKDMRRVRNVNGLVCKACALGFDPGSLSDRRDFSLPQLVNHFQKVHVEQAEQQGRRVLDWTTDMVLLPASSVLSELQQSIAGNKKADLVREALAQLPQEGAPVTNSGAGLGISSGSARPPGQPPFGEQYFSRPADDHNKYYGPPHGNGGHPYRHDVPDVKEAEGAIRHRGDESWARNRPDDYASPIVGPQPPAAKPSVPVADYRDSGESSPRGGFVQYSRPAMPPQDGHGRGYDSRELADDRNSGFNSRYVEQPRPVPRDPGPPPGYAREACAYDGGPSGIRRTPDRNAGYGEPGQVRSRSRSPLAYSRQPGTQYPGYYRERSPRMRPAERPYPPEFHSQRPMDHDQYGPPNRGEYFRTLEEARRADPGRNFPHGFEIVRVKEPSGEYYIRRPIRPEHGPGFEPPADHARGPEWYGNGRREADARYAPPESEYRPRQPSLGPAYRQPPSHGYDERMHGFEPGPPQPMRSHGRRPFEQLPERAPGPDPSYAEEYDPRFPAAPPAGGPRQVRY